MSRYQAVLDACVLAPMPIADTLLRLAERGVFRPLWSDEILNEVAGTLRKFGYGEHLLEKRLVVMREQFPEAMVHHVDAIAIPPELPDPGDAHVLAAAVKANADAIVTFNIRHFPASVCDLYGLDVLDPDTFLINQLDLDTKLVCNVLREQATAMRHPAVSLARLLDYLRAAAPEFTALVEIELAGGR